MKLVRPIVIAVLLVGAFFYLTTYRSGKFRLVNSPAPKVNITEAANNAEPLDSEEQNNISVYRRNIGSVVNITSRAVTLDFFYGLVPQEGQGSGFIEWPSSSFMIRQTRWIYYGSAIAAVGISIIVFSRR